jgi:hypothetical protein
VRGGAARPGRAIAEANALARRWLRLAPDAGAIGEAATEELLDPATLRPLRAEEMPWAGALAGAAGEAAAEEEEEEEEVVVVVVVVLADVTRECREAARRMSRDSFTMVSRWFW